MRCCAYPGIGRIAPDCAGPDPPAWQLPCQLCGFIRSRSKGLSIVRARILSSVRFGEQCGRNFNSVWDTFCLIASQCPGPPLSGWGWYATILTVCIPAGAREGSARLQQITCSEGFSMFTKPDL